MWAIAGLALLLGLGPGRAARAEPVALLGMPSTQICARMVQQSWRHTVPAGGRNRFLVVLIQVDHTRGINSPFVEAVSFAGRPLTRIGRVSEPGFTHAEIWGMAAPPEGIYDALVRLTAVGSFIAGALVFTGVLQDPRALRFDFTLGIGGSAALDVRSAPGDRVVHVLAATDGDLPVPVPPATRHWAIRNAGVSGAASSAGADTVRLTWSTAGPQEDWSLAAVVLAQAPPDDGGAPSADAAPDASGEPAPEPDAAAPDAGLDAPPAAIGPVNLRVGCACRVGAPGGGGSAIALPIVLVAAALRRRSSTGSRGAASSPRPAAGTASAAAASGPSCSPQ